jgi:peptidyl-prolyl cis-trans isomerase A (cyclophilin A)
MKTLSFPSLCFALLVFAGFCCAPSPVTAQTDGLYAEFNTSMGSFTCRLEYATSPKAVANFIGLATGERAWLDLPSGLVKTNPFYNGLTFHRVIAGFMNQSGSPNGQGTDGAGYTFRDEFSPTLRHDGFGVLSMANSGPDSNGSQFFITAGPTGWLDDKHTVFGRLTGGSNVVYAINNVATDANSKPLTNVVIHTVNIRRVGIAAQSFDLHAQGLPNVIHPATQISKQSTNVAITFSNLLYADNRLYSSSNLTQWTGAQLGIETSGPVSNSVTRSASAPAQFFRLAQIQYPSSTFAPKHLWGRTLTLRFNGGYGTNVIAFNSSGGGTYNWSIGFSGSVTSYTWVQEPYRGRLWPIYMSGLYPMTLRMDFTNDLSGSFEGSYHQSPPLAMSGSFSFAP